MTTVHTGQKDAALDSWATHSKNSADRYLKLWSKNEKKAEEIDIEAINQERLERKLHYKDAAADYYDLTTPNYENSWGEHFHFCRFTKAGESIDCALRTHEHYMALMTGMKPGMRVLDAGCGIGGPAREMARFAEVKLTGITINKLHIERATQLTKEAGLSHLADFVVGDFMDMPFEDDTFDVVYSMEATVHSNDLGKCYAEIARVLKPGGVFGTYEWLMTPKFDGKNANHVEMRERIEKGSGVCDIYNVAEGIEAVRLAGLEMTQHEDLALRPDRDPWWWCLDGDHKRASNKHDRNMVWWLKESHWIWLYRLVGVLEKLGMTRVGATAATKTVSLEVFGMRDAAREGIFTPMYNMLARKPVEGWKPLVQPLSRERQSEGK